MKVNLVGCTVQTAPERLLTFDEDAFDDLVCLLTVGKWGKVG